MYIVWYGEAFTQLRRCLSVATQRRRRRIVAGFQRVACTRQSRGALSAKAESPFTPLYRDRGARYRSQLQRAQGPHS